MTWILILALTVGDSPAVTTREFQSKEACENAAKTFQGKYDSLSRDSVAVCTPSDVLSPLR